MAKAQTEIPGTERPSIPEVEEAAEDYRALRDERMALAEKEAEAKRTLITKMKAHNQTAYRYEDNDGVERKVILDEKTNAKVAKVKRENPDEGSTVGDGSDGISVQ